MRKQTYINFRIIAKTLGVFIMIIGALMLVPTMVAFYYGGPDRLPLLGAALFSLCVGLVLHKGVCRENLSGMPQMQRREGYIIVAFSWIAMSIFGAVPFLINHDISTFTDAIFETISGLTTTGLSILEDVEALPKGLLFWRSMTQWIGGIGIIVFGLAILPLIGISGGNNLFAAESTGPTKDKIHPKISSTAKTIVIIYICLTALQTIFLLFGEMNLFDAVCHSFATIATGGFSTQNASLVGYSSYTQYVVSAFMFLSGINFGLYFFAITGKFEKILKNSELKTYFGFVFLSVLILAIMLWITHADSNLSKTIQDAIFMVVSIITTTGFTGADYTQWMPSVNLFLIVMMFMGASSGSTAGGIKMGRFSLLLKNSAIEFKRLVHPRAVIPVRYNGQAVSPEIIFRVLAFFFLYITIVILGTISFSIMGYNTDAALGISASALGNVGIGVGEISTAHACAEMPMFGKWVLSLFMLIGRLELFTVLILFTPAFWKK
ncbi:MAG: TrkH family potassium uptake protein [Bacteroidales bacterium]|jgi:trk system potassium uptake protein TrkH|nr:TrkH family potassium uptake protein [Bacteroidales bacterium]